MRDQFNSLSQQRGFLAIVAIVLIVIVGFLGLATAYLAFGSGGASTNFSQGEKALDIAEAGFEQSARLLLTPFLTGANLRIACSAITGNANLTNKAFSTGTFTATTVSGSPVYINTTLSGAINNSVTTIPVASTAGFAAAGRLMIDSEVLNYGAISGNSFIGVQRGVNMSYNTSHASGARVAQYQCSIDVDGGIPNLTSPLYQREIQQSVQLQEAWAVGNATGSAFTFTRWNRPTELAWTNSSLASGVDDHLLSVSMLSNADGWAVGSVVGSTFSILRWNGSSWSLTAGPTACSNQDLSGVSSVSSNEAWAVGLRYRAACAGSGPQRYTIMRWNGSSWSLLIPASIPADNNANQNLNAVHVIDTTHSGTGNLGFAVGANGTILKYNGSVWTTESSPVTNNLFGVYVVSASEAWAVGASGRILRWNGSTWSSVASPTTTQLNAIVMQDAAQSGIASSGWAVGNNGVAVKYNGSSWASQNTGSSRTMNGVAMFNSTSEDVWAAGAVGTLMHWDGSAWTSIASNVTQDLNAISVVAPQQYPFAWQEIFP